MLTKIFRSLKEKFLFEFFIDSPVSDKDYPDSVVISKSVGTGNAWQPMFLFDNCSRVYFINKEPTDNVLEAERVSDKDLIQLGEFRLSTYDPRPGDTIKMSFSSPDGDLADIFKVSEDGALFCEEGVVPKIAGLPMTMSGEIQFVVNLSNDGRLKKLEDRFLKPKEAPCAS